jgi:hypothetical protein
MNHSIGPISFLLAGIVLLSLAQVKSKEYSTPAGERVVVRSSIKAEATPESHIEFYGKDKKMLCSLDYSSADGEHGYGVEKAEWTPDGNYFVLSLASSGGHQAWHSPTIAYSRDKKWIIYLDDFTDALGVSSIDFHLETPNWVSTHMLKDRDIPVRFNLDKLFRKAKLAKIAKGVSCTGGKTRKVGSGL